MSLEIQARLHREVRFASSLSGGFTMAEILQKKTVKTHLCAAVWPVWSVPASLDLIVSCY